MWSRSIFLGYDNHFRKYPFFKYNFYCYDDYCEWEDVVFSLVWPLLRRITEDIFDWKKVSKCVLRNPRSSRRLHWILKFQPCGRPLSQPFVLIASRIFRTRRSNVFVHLVFFVQSVTLTDCCDVCVAYCERADGNVFLFVVADGEGLGVDFCSFVTR